MYKLSQRSKDRKKGVHPELDNLTDWLLQFIDIGINQDGGVRTKERQQELVNSGASKTLNSKHLIQDDGYGHAIDYGIYIKGKLTWDTRYYYVMMGLIMVYCDMHGVKFRLGRDWDGDMDFSDQTFNDLCHVEFVGYYEN